MKESTFSHSLIDINKISNPSPIYCFLLHCWVHICLETAFIDLLLSCSLFVCLGTFLTHGVTQKLPVETKLQLTGKQRDVAWTVARFRCRQVASHIFSLLMIIYCHLLYSCCYYLLWFGMPALCVYFSGCAWDLDLGNWVFIWVTGMYMYCI